MNGREFQTEGSASENALLQNMDVQTACFSFYNGPNPFKNRTPLSLHVELHAHQIAGTSKGTHGDAKCVTEILGDKNKEVRGQNLG